MREEGSRVREEGRSGRGPVNPGLVNLHTLTRRGVEAATCLLSSLETEAARARNLLRSLEHQLIGNGVFMIMQPFTTGGVRVCVNFE